MFESDEDNDNNQNDDDDDGNLDLSFNVDDPDPVLSSGNGGSASRYSLLGNEEEETNGGGAGGGGNIMRSIFDIDEEEEEQKIPDPRSSKKRPLSTNEGESPPFKVPTLPHPNPSSRNDDKRQVQSPRGSIVAPLPDDGPRRRKFPGPAGSLPSLRKLNHQESPESSKESDAIRRRRLLNQEKSFVESDAWRKMLEDREVKESDPSDMINKYNVAWIKSGTSKLGDSKRTPLLTCVLRQIIDPNALDPRCCLEDRTGRVEATIHRAVVERYGPYMHPGTVMVLRNASVIWGAKRRPLVIVTLDNLVAMYRQREGGGNESDSVRLVTKQELDEIARLSEEYERKLLQNAKTRQETRQNRQQISSSSSSFRPVQCSTPLASGPSLFSPDNHRFQANSPSQTTVNLFASQSATTTMMPPLSLSSSSVAHNSVQGFSTGNDTGSQSFGRFNNPVSVQPSNPVQGKFVFKPNLPNILDDSRSATVFPASQSHRDLFDPILGDTLDGLDEDSLFGDF